MKNSNAEERNCLFNFCVLIVWENENKTASDLINSDKRTDEKRGENNEYDIQKDKLQQTIHSTLRELFKL